MSPQHVATEVAFGPELGIGDPYVRRIGAAAAFSVGVGRLGVPLRVELFPRLGELERTGALEDLLERGLAPTTSVVTGQVLSGLDLDVVRVGTERRRGIGRVGVVVGLARTVDDLGLQGMTAPAQVHPTLGAALAPELVVGDVGLRVRAAGTTWNEDFEGHLDARRVHLWTSFELVLSPR